MTVSLKRERIFLIVLLLLFILAILGGTYFFLATKNLNSRLNAELLHSELLLSEKLALEKNSVAYENEINRLKIRHVVLDESIAQMQLEIDEKEAAIRRAEREKRSVKLLNSQLAELELKKNESESVVGKMKELVRKLTDEKNAIDQSMSGLQEENKQLRNEMKELRSSSADHFLAETTNRRDRQTVVARRTKKIKVNFKVPEKMASTISVKVIPPDGKVLEGTENGIAHRIVNNENKFTASLNSGVVNELKEIELTYEPTLKPLAGIYRIEVFNNEKYVGNLNVKLR